MSSWRTRVESDGRCQQLSPPTAWIVDVHRDRLQVSESCGEWPTTFGTVPERCAASLEFGIDLADNVWCGSPARMNDVWYHSATCTRCKPPENDHIAVRHFTVLCLWQRFRPYVSPRQRIFNAGIELGDDCQQLSSPLMN